MSVLEKKILAPNSALFIGIAVIFMLIMAGCANNAAASVAGDEPTDPQKLLIPRWFLSALELDGQAFAIAEDQQSMTLQFKEDGSVNGGGGCNDFFGTYEAGQDSTLTFGPIGATKMLCEDSSQLEATYFEALSKVEKFRFEDYRLVLSSQDGKTKLVYRMPPK